MRLRVVPVELRDANAFIETHHRHHRRVQGHRFSVGVVDEDGNLHGVAVVGRPTSGLDPAPALDDRTLPNRNEIALANRSPL